MVGLRMTFRNHIGKIVVLVLWTVLMSSCALLRPAHYPPRQGVYHHVDKGQTLYAIAQAYGVDVNQLRRINRIRDPKRLEQGTYLWIPGATQVVNVKTGKSSTVYSKKKSTRPTYQGQKKKSQDKVVARKPVKNFLMWPVDGIVTSKFGKRDGGKHEGIDIGAKNGTGIFAAAAGTVKFSGWGPTGYGKMVIVKHPNHLTTVYAHNSRNLVKQGAKVKKGQLIARVGTTGRATGPHLHFEVRNDTHPKDPLSYLP